MVRTRHSGDVRADSPPRFLSLEGRRSKKSRSHTSDVDDINDSDQSGIIYGRSGHSIFEEKVVESRLRPRVGPRRAYNYVYEDSSDDDSEAIFSRRRQVRLVSDIPHTSGQRRRYAERERSHSSEEDTEESVLRSTRNLPRTRNQLDESLEEEDAEHGSGDDDENDMNNSAVRRSSRLRQKPYRFRNSMTESQEDKGHSGDREDRGKKRHLNDTVSNEYEDMYSRVKRPRNKKSSGQGQENSVSNTDASNDEAEGKHDSEDETQQRRAYSLREHKPRTQLYMAPAIEAIKKKPKQQSIFRETPPRRLSKHVPYRSPAHRNIVFRKRQAFHGSSSSTSSDSSESETETDEQHFNRRKAKSMAKARSRIMPLNFTNDTVNSTVLKDRIRAGASLADVDPMEIDRSVTFENIGGLQNHIMALKEMIVFPLLYPEFYEKFKVAPSRGVLFYGPPGTGKTLVARALANECSQGKQRVAFFMRKGADCLSKWVGEAERQLRLLFDKAYEMRPSIIFFDEIDGLAPVRSSRQDQIHSSIVSTLLALMDGLDCRGEIVVIGATNRIDSIDPALRRPGRFDREFHFPLPNFEDRKKILKIHTKSWDPLLRGDFITELAEKCAGYCGADIKCLVTQATQNALRRHYPQIYTTSDKLQLDVGSITLTARDFAHALTTIVPAAQRAVPNPSMALEPSVRPLLQRPLKSLCEALVNRFPHARLCKAEVVSSGQESFIGTSAEDRLKIVDLPSDDEDAPSIFMTHSRGQTQAGSTLDIPAGSSFMGFSSSASNFPTLFRPRLLVSGELGQGQTVHLAPAALHFMEHLSVHTLSSAALFAASAKMPEEACANIFHEAKRTAPSVIYMPYINELWSVVTDSLRVTFLTLVRSMTPTTPVLLLATSEVPYSRLEEQLKQLFSKAGGEVVELESPTSEERHLFFADLILHQTIKPPTTHKQAVLRSLHFFPTKTSRINKKGLGSKAFAEMKVEKLKCGTSKMKQLAKLSSHNYRIDNLQMQETCTDCRYDTRYSGDKTPLKGKLDVLHNSFPQHHICTDEMEVIVSKESQSESLSSCGSLNERIVSPSSKDPNFNSCSQFEIVSNSLKVKNKVCKTILLPSSLLKTSATAKAKQYQSSFEHLVPTRKVLFGSKTFLNKTLASTLSKKCHFRSSVNLNQSTACSILFNSDQPIVSKLGTETRVVICEKCFPSGEIICTTSGSQSGERDNKMYLTHEGRHEAKRILQPLPKAPPPESHQLTEKEEKMLFEQEEDTLRELRIFLRDILSKLGREKKFSIFTKPVDIEDVPDYYDIIKKPMDLSTMMGKIDLHHYTTTSAFMDDIFLICSNALEYNPDKGPTDRAIRHRACALRDTAQALLKAELDPAFEKLCQEISQSRKNRGVDSTNMAPAFYRTRPISAPLSNISTCHGSPAKVPIVPDGCRFSRRVRGLSADKTLPVDIVEKSAQIERSLLTKGSDTLETETGNASSSEVECIIPQKVETLAEMQQPVSCTEKSMCNCNNSASSVKSNYLGKNSKINCDTRSQLSSSALKKLNLRKKCPWLATRRRKRHYLHVPGKEIQSHRSETEIKNMLTESCGHEADLHQDSVQLCEEISPELLLAHSTLQLPSTTKTLTHSASHQNRTSSSEVCINSSEMDLTQVQNSNSEQIKQKLASSDACPCSDSTGGSEQRPEAARCLEVELNAVATDSGVGSSLESNGDSRDSLEHNNSNKTSVIATESQDSGQEDEGIKFARTRARMQNPLHISAFRALEIETQPIIVDKEKLKQLLEDTVQSTEGFSVEKLQHLYSVLSCTVYRHRQQYNKNQLVQEMEKIVENFCVDGGAV